MVITNVFTLGDWFQKPPQMPKSRCTVSYDKMVLYLQGSPPILWVISELFIILNTRQMQWKLLPY
jgi:hypothetical protein